MLNTGAMKGWHVATSPIDHCPVCAGLDDYRRMLQGYLRDRCARMLTPLLSEMLFNLQAQIKTCNGQCTWTAAALELHEAASTLLTQVWDELNAHRLYLEYILHPYEALRTSGLNLKAMRAYLESNGLLPLRNPEANDSDFAAALDKYLNLCQREGMHHIVERWLLAIEHGERIPMIEPPF